MSGAEVGLLLGRCGSVAKREVVAECVSEGWISPLYAIRSNCGGCTRVSVDSFPGNGSKDLQLFFSVMHQVIGE